MDHERAVKIMNSLENINVTYNGDSVWIEGIDHESQEVQVTILCTHEMTRVPINQLKEIGPVSGMI
ncbi:H-type small acid-soluble spore protein [Irregularibacter muris]|uniref:H-type small acid-soluble spore protein n=1 Tax=Irregularibacter muris TaxID=1796619 RepID=A0AAE3HH85_9FIRM|nr:H-type small acid-soluble spore protein [Irregularibacter muris]MCR1899375.1 H-type small acid-soluble spore protein [Irregularibacter muris]